MNDWVIPQLVKLFKEAYGVHLESAADLWQTEMNVLEMLVQLGRKVVADLFSQAGTGYQGSRVKKEGEAEYRFVGNREKVLHGLFGGVSFKRAYYVSKDGRRNWFPLDEQLGIQKKHTPGCQYFLASFTAREGYQESLEHFHEIFRPDAVELISMRKALDMDYELGSRLEGKRQAEIQQLFEHTQVPEIEREITDVMVVSVDATKVRVKVKEWVDDEGRRRYETEFRDAKIASVSALGWNATKEEPFCHQHSYICGIEHADEFFRRIWVEMNRRCCDLSKIRLVFIGDGAKWIWDRIRELANLRSVYILDFYHASEHLSELCKHLFGEATDAYWQHYRQWQKRFLQGKVLPLIEELKKMRDGPLRRSKGDGIQEQISYFQDNACRMQYQKYRRMRLPIGSGTVESGCKTVIAKRLKQSGMTWTLSAARGMLQMRASLKSSRFRKDFTSVLPLASAGLAEAA